MYRLANSRRLEKTMVDLVDIVLPANAQSAAESLGLRVERSVTTGTRVRGIPRDDAEIAVACLRDWGVTARILPHVAPATEKPAA